MKERLIDYVLFLVIGFGLILALIFVYQDLQKEIEKANNEVFIKDKAYYQENIGEIQEKLDSIYKNVSIIADQLKIDIIYITD